MREMVPIALNRALGWIARCRLIWIIAWLAPLPCMSCATDRSGALYAEVWRNQDATVVRVRVLGLQIRFRKDDAGISIGATERIYVFGPNDLGVLTTGGHWFGVALPASDSLINAARTWGLEMTCASAEYAVTLGFRQRVVLARLAASDSVAFAADVDLRAPENTTLRVLHWGNEQ